MYFDKMRQFQDNNDRKHRQLSNFLTHDIQALAKRDEQIYLKAVAEKEDRA